MTWARRHRRWIVLAIGAFNFWVWTFAGAGINLFTAGTAFGFLLMDPPETADAR